MLPTSKSIMLIVDTQATAGETNVPKFDRLGYDFVSVDVALMGVEDGTTVTVLKMGESADNTTFTNISGAVGGTDFTIPTALRTLGDATGPTVVRFDMDMRSRKRYLQLTVASGTKTVEVLNARLSRGGPDGTPVTATKAGVDVLVAV